MTGAKQYIIITFTDQDATYEVDCSEKQCLTAIIELSQYLSGDSLYILQDIANVMWRGKERETTMLSTEMNENRGIN